MRKTWLIAPTFIALAITACSTAQVMQPIAASTPILTSVPAQVDGSTVEVRIDTGAKMQTKAAKKTAADIHHYHIKLVSTKTNVVVAEGDTTEIVNFFHKVPNGTYQVLVDAFDVNGNSIVQGGAQASTNFVTVSSPSVTYSDGANCLKVHLKLLDATGEKVGSKIIVEDGSDWTGTPELVSGGDCPCPTSTPTPEPTPTPSAPIGEDFQITAFSTTNTYEVTHPPDWPFYGLFYYHDQNAAAEYFGPGSSSVTVDFLNTAHITGVNVGRLETYNIPGTLTPSNRVNSLRVAFYDQQGNELPGGQQFNDVRISPQSGDAPLHISFPSAPIPFKLKILIDSQFHTILQHVHIFGYQVAQ